MARVILTIEDLEDEDGVKLTLEFDPPFDASEDGEGTDAQMGGLIAIRAIQDAGSEAKSETRCVDCRDLYGQCAGCALNDPGCGCSAPCTC